MCLAQNCNNNVKLRIASDRDQRKKNKVVREASYNALTGSGVLVGLTGAGARRLKVWLLYQLHLKNQLSGDKLISSF